MKLAPVILIEAVVVTDVLMMDIEVVSLEVSFIILAIRILQVWIDLVALPVSTIFPPFVVTSLTYAIAKAMSRAKVG